MDMEQLGSSVGSNETKLPGNQVVSSLEQPAEDLIREISVLEMEVAFLEKHLLSMYRQRFGLATLSETDYTAKGNSAATTSPAAPPPPPPPLASVGNNTLEDSSILRCQSSLSHGAYSFRASTSPPPLAESDDLCSVVSQSPNWISEEMIKCMSAIYCKLANPPLFCSHGYTFSPASFPCSQSGENSSFHSWSDNPFHAEDQPTESCGPFVDLRGLYRDDHSLSRVHHMLQRFRCLVSQMEQIDPRRMKHEEKLAFWINVHNALVMHAFLVYGIPRSNLKRVSLLPKAAYNIGGKAVSVEMIQSCILGCQLPRPGQWLHLFFPKQKFKSKDPRRAYAIEHREPRLRFALCSGSHSDPVVRLYTPKRVLLDLEVAKEEYLKTNIRVYEEQQKLQLMLPRNVECFIKEVGLWSYGLLDMIDQSLPENFRQKFKQTDKGKLLKKKIDWIPHSFSFRFLVSNELAESLLSI